MSRLSGASAHVAGGTNRNSTRPSAHELPISSTESLETLRDCSYGQNTGTQREDEFCCCSLFSLCLWEGYRRSNFQASTFYCSRCSDPALTSLDSYIPSSYPLKSFANVCPLGRRLAGCLGEAACPSLQGRYLEGQRDSVILETKAGASMVVRAVGLRKYTYSLLKPQNNPSYPRRIRCVCCMILLASH